MLKLSLVASLLALCVGTANAGLQQEKMATCNKDAATQSLKGDARKVFMSSCLKAAPASVWNKHPRAKELISRFNRGLKTIKGSGDFKKMIIETRSKINQRKKERKKERKKGINSPFYSVLFVATNCST